MRQTPFTHLQGAPGLPTAPPYFGLVSVGDGVVVTGGAGWPALADGWPDEPVCGVVEGAAGWVAVAGGVAGWVAGGVAATTGGRVAGGGAAWDRGFAG